VDCRAVREHLLAPEPGVPGVDEHLSACAACARLATALGELDAAVRPALVLPPPEGLKAQLAANARLDAAMRSALMVQPPVEVQERLASLLDSGAAEVVNAAAEDRVAAAMKAALLRTPPPELQTQLAALVETHAAEQAEAAARVDAAMRSALVLEAPVQVRQRLAQLVPSNGDAATGLAGIWQRLRERPGVFAGQLAALAVLAYVVAQVFAWLGTLPVVIGDVPYALELLVFSPAVDYLGQIEGLAQQLALWLVVGAAGLILVRGFPPRRQLEP